MKITKLQTWLVRPRWAFIEISTDAGISGWGEPVLEGRAATVCECIHEMEPYLIGADPMKIEDLWTVLFRGGFYRGGGILMSAISGIDQALWDIKGKYFNVPVWQLMGGSCRDKMRVYSWVGGDRPADVGRAALEKKKQGFTAIKMNGTDELQFLDSYAKIDALLERVASVRESCGKDFGIAIDFHGRVHKPMAKIVAKKLEEFDPMFIEEPVHCMNPSLQRKVSRSVNIPLAAGERIYTRWGYSRYFEDQSLNVIQPDICLVGGISEAKKDCDSASVYDVTVKAHVCGSPVSTAAALQVEAAISNFQIHELHIVGLQGYNRQLCLQDNLPVRGKFKVPDEPGLGVDLNDKFLETQPKLTVK